MRFYNTLGRNMQDFQPIEEKVAKMYTCGPTVYNYAHIGNFRAYLFEDLLRRSLEYHGYKVTQVMNLTDVDDKTIRDSRAAGLKLQDFTRKYKDAFFEDLKTLRIEPAEHYPEATTHIPEMIEMIRILFEKGFAYKSEDGSVYFSIAKFKDYGKLAKIDMEQQRSGVRINNDEYDKDSVADFALWKAWSESDGDVKWDSPWGPGRPGWHLECSAMSMKYLGRTFDIHTGGIDNMFPHHEDEIAQSEAANSCKFVNYWLHCEHLTIDKKKMSKSLGNFYTLRDLLNKGYSGKEVRWALIGTHYRSKLNFNLGLCDQARSTLKKFADFFGRLKALPQGTAGKEEALRLAADADRKFADAIGDDLNIAEALSAVFTLERAVNTALASNSLQSEAGGVILEQFRRFDRVLAVFDVDAAASEEAEDVPAGIMALAQKRIEARKAKDFKTADEIRDSLKAQGWVIIDTPQGMKVKKA
ncbi:MAG TPA: cysteine--tRNA ligase [Lentisphaeria bacterium]|nr:cysteine--tRNA ligase [Lentisphaeria bacterium]HCG51419.1 cysteine--tRNA ligase [Lentisphaeria bacterium]